MASQVAEDEGVVSDECPAPDAQNVSRASDPLTVHRPLTLTPEKQLPLPLDLNPDLREGHPITPEPPISNSDSVVEIQVKRVYFVFYDIFMAFIPM